MGLFDSGGYYNSFTPPAYTAERNALDPMIWGMLADQMSGKPTTADYRNRDAGMAAAQQQYKDMNRATGMDFGARGLGDSGWLGQAQGRNLGQRAMMEADVMARFWDDIIARQMQAAGMGGNYLAGARAGSGTYKTKG